MKPMTQDQEDLFKTLLNRLEYLVADVRDFLDEVQYGDQPSLCDVCPDEEDIL